VSSASVVREILPPTSAPSGRRRLGPAGYALVKRLLDVALVLAAAPAWLPVFGLCAICLKLSDPEAPVFFTQQRTGLGGRRFVLYKFRTMIPKAHLLKREMAHLNQRPGPHFKAREDPRVTAVGRHLRRFYLDELPQLINVLSGDMSLVGPRPTSVEPVAHALWQTERLAAKPGLTCLWQLQEDEYPSFDDRARLDILYCRNRCLALDLEILFRTATHVLGGHGY
jgi:lipopolysaccharide/colanic/teichoic acid biosynthesis glycosyltransferase